MKKIKAPALVLCVLLLSALVFGVAASAADVALPYTTKLSENLPTENFIESGDRSATFHGNWKPIAYPTGSYGVASARLELDTVINVAAGATSTGDGFLAPNGMWQFESAPVMRIKGDGGYWSVSGTLGWKSTHTVGFQYTAEQTGTVDLSFERLHGVRAGKTTYVAVFVNNKMVWPTEDGAAEKSEGLWYADWYPLSSTANISTSVNISPLLKGISLKAGDTVEFMLAGEEGSTIFSANTVAIRPVVTYGTGASEEPTPDQPTPDTPNPDRPAVPGIHVSALSGNLPTNTFDTDGDRAATFSPYWIPVAYPVGSYGSQTAMLVCDTMINTGSGAHDAFYAPNGMWQFESAPVVRVDGGNDYWGDAGALGCGASHTVGWRYTAEKTGLANIVFEKLAGLGRGKPCYVAVFLNGRMIWPVAGGEAENGGAIAHENWYAVSGKEDLAATVNADPLLAGLVLSKGDVLEFMLGGTAGTTIFSANTVNMQPVVAYTSLIEAPKPGSASIVLGEAFAVNLYVDPDSVMEGATNLGAYINGTFIPAVDGCVRVEGIAAKNLVDKIKIKPTCTLVGNELVGEEISVSPVDVLMQYVTGEDVSAEVKNLAVATLNYATAAQDFFGYGIDSAANDGLSAEEKKPTYAGTYASILAKAGDAAANVATLHSASLIIGDTVGMKFVFTGAPSSFAANFTVALLDADGKAVKTVTPTLCEGQTGTYKVIFDGLLPTDWNTAYTVAVISMGDAGNATPTPVGETLTYSVMSYLVRIAEESVSMKYTLIPAMYALYEAAIAYEAAQV